MLRKDAQITDRFLFSMTPLLGFMFQGAGFRVKGSQFRVWGLGFRAYGLGCRLNVRELRGIDGQGGE